ncbi:MAG: thiol:disulfide interchange protein DsbA/DsbL [Betaproteobacteria bacterium]
MIFSRLIRCFGIPLFAALFIGNAPAQAIREIVPINPPQPVENDGKIEVLEFFAYGCIHCANLEPRLADWVSKQPADVKVKRVPAPFPIRGIDSPPIFYTLEAMGLQEKLHQKIFDAANLENVMLGNPAVLNKWLEKQGVDPKRYEELQRSFSVQTKIARARKMSGDYKIPSTPTMTVNGRFLLEGGSERLFSNIDRLVEEARGPAKPVAAPAKPAVTVTPAAPAAPAKKK